LLSSGGECCNGTLAPPGQFYARRPKGQTSAYGIEPSTQGAKKKDEQRRHDRFRNAAPVGKRAYAQSEQSRLRNPEKGCQGLHEGSACQLGGHYFS
jgi:hypothetical protein